MVYLLAVVTGLGAGWLIGCLGDYISTHSRSLRVKEVKEELTHNKLGTEPPCTA